MMFGTREGFDYLECRGCGSLQIDEAPADLDRYYAAPYYTSETGSPQQADVEPSAFRGAWSRLRLRHGALPRLISGRRYARFDWFRHTGTGLDDAILDVGCGAGRLTYRLAAEGFDHLVGIDPRFEGSVGADDSSPRFERTSLFDHEGRYRLVMAHHSFEHLADPRAGFDAFARLVEPDGYLLLRIPIADCWARQEYGPDWVQLDAPRHLHLHTRRSIEFLARRSGFRVEQVSDDSGPFQIWGSELYRRDIPLSEAGPRGRQILTLRERLAARLRARRLRRIQQGDQACFYLRRTADG